MTAHITRARNADFIIFGVNGFAFATWMSRVPDAKQMLDLTPGALGVMLLAISVGSLVGLPVAGRLAHKYGAANAVRLGAVLSLPGLILAAFAVQYGDSIFLVMPGLFLVGLGFGVWDVSQNLEGTIIEQGLGRAIMPWFHAMFSGGTVLGALIGAALVWGGVGLVPHLVAVAVVGAVAVWWATRDFLPAYDEAGHEADAGAGSPVPAKQRSAWLEPRTLLIGLVVLAAAFAEGTANDWMAVAFVEGHDLDNALGVVALAVFLSFMTAGRILGTGLLDRYGRVPVLRILFIAAIVGCVLVVFGNVWIAFIGCAIWGIGASLGFPVGMSAAADDPRRAPLRLSVVSTIGYTAFLAGPPLLGFLGNEFGVLNSLLVVGAVSVLALLVVPATRPLEPAR
ncbi:MFS transporter [Demequina sp.]|uniref:MFS transporter n=1 Tax=Demequina sp. TaxID=2050685 RepID=UPI003D0A937D